MSYDIVGDVHGQYDKLVALLRTLGYRETFRTWRHPDRTAIFVGDLIDRGPRQLDTLRLVRSMIDAGAARTIMGNHELNAISWATPDPQHPGEFLRSRTKPGHREQHAAFLAEVEDKPRLHAEIVEWLRTLPLWLDLGGIRVVHACWSERYLSALAPHLGPDATLTDAVLVAAARKGSVVHAAIEALCKGLEVALPSGVEFRDKDGKTRRSARIRWWEAGPTTLQRAALASADVLAQLPDVPVAPDSRVAPYAGPPVFFGHYWLTQRPAPLGPNVACVDYSAGAGEKLVAYRWEGEEVLRATHFLWV
jgi:hypothetical protein